MSDENTGIKLVKQQVGKAVEALFAVIKQKQNVKKLLGESEKINLQFCFKKIPQARNITIKIKLPHPLTHDTTDVCLFAKDLDKTDRDYEPTVRHFKELLDKHGVKCVTEVIPLKALKLEYKPFEAKRSLSNMFDLFIADERIIRLLPPFLGKNFYGRKRNPIQVNMKAKDLKKEISKAVDNTRCYITGKGSSCLVTIAHTGMKTDEIVENILAAVEQLSLKIPGGPDNMRLCGIKTISSTSIPLYASVGSRTSVDMPKKKRSEFAKTKPEEITTLVGSKVKVRADGKVFIVKNNTSKVGDLGHQNKEDRPKRGIRKRTRSRQPKEKKCHRPLLNSGTKKFAQKDKTTSRGKDKTRSMQKSSKVKKAKKVSTKSTVKGFLGEAPVTKKRKTGKV